jgi:hypothetical protein
MKKLFIAALFAASVFTSAFAAGTNKINHKAVRTFKYEFQDATNVEWSVKENFSKAVFTVNEERAEAFFDVEGNLIGTSRSISMDKLPTSAKRAFGKKYSDYTVKETIRFEDGEATSYYVSAENEKESVILKINGSNVSLFKRTSK